MKWMLTFLALIGCETIESAVYQFPLVRVQSKMMEMMQKGTWGAHVKRKDAARLQVAEKLTNNNIHSQNLIDYYDCEYYGNITIGTPEQTFQVVLDTLSADVWIPDYTCSPHLPPICAQPKCDAGMICHVFCPDKTCCVSKKYDTCKGKRLFDSKMSSTYLTAEGKWDIKDVAEGFLGNDTIRFGNVGSTRLEVPGAIFGQATKLGQITKRERHEGILGLAFEKSSKMNVIPVLQRAAELRLIDSIFTVHMTHSEQMGGVGGMITYGGIDTANCHEKIVYEKLTSDSLWQFKLFNVSATTMISTEKWEAASATSSAFIFAPTRIARLIAAQCGAEYDMEQHAFFIDCNAKPTITFCIGDDTYTIEAVNLVVKSISGRCVFMVALTDGTGFSANWILGMPFIRQYCHVHDMGNKRIGFAKPR